MFVQPSQIAKILSNIFDDKVKGRLVVSRQNNRDKLTLNIEYIYLIKMKKKI